MVFFLVLCIFFAGDSGLAASKSSTVSTTTTNTQKKTTINFEDQLVEGELKKPELFYLLQKKQINFGRMIKMRENFLPEMRRTNEELQRGNGRL